MTGPLPAVNCASRALVNILPPTQAELAASAKKLGEVYCMASDRSGGKAGRKIRRTEVVLSARRPSAKDLTVHSFRFNEFLYQREPCPFPILARGLFTTVASDGTPRVLARGYDKFFNVGEVRRTKWESIISATKGPYEVTTKENGCIIFISARDDGGLLYTSKHAVGGAPSEAPTGISHAEVGYRWLTKHLSDVGKTEEDFAAALRQADLTAVFELCDDEFEEHILPYKGADRGLYLHGLNRNLADFRTLPSSVVREFAIEWGFHQTGCVVKHTAEEVSQFTNEVKQAGGMDGRAIEGFVIRCRLTADDSVFFFKIKYEEPYLMYREWREVTNRILSGNPFKVSYPLTNQYVAWVKDMRKKNPALFTEYKHHHGIIQVREMFLNDLKRTPGCSGSDNTTRELESSFRKKTVVMPVATIGCGKTTVSLVIADLFGCGHIQNDNITKKKAGGKAFNEAVIKELTDHDIVIADRNNHLRQLRGDLTTAVKGAFPDCRVVCFYWDITQEPSPRVVEVTRKRVMDRGENHQSLTPGRNPQFDMVIHSFVNNFQPLDSNFREDSLIDEIVQFSVTDTLRQNARVAISAVAELCGLPVPSAARVEEALAKATTDYRTTVVKNVKNKKRRKDNWHYYGLVVRGNDVKTLVDRCLEGNAVPSDVLGQWRSSTMVEAPHVTLVHKKHMAGQAQGEKIWNLCKAKVESSNEAVRCQFMVSRLLRTRDVLVLEVVPGSFDPAWIECASSYPHVTVAVGGGLSPFEGFAATKRYRDAIEETARPTAQPEKAELRERGSTESAPGDDAAESAAARTSLAADIDVEAYAISPDGRPVAMEGILRGLY